MLEGALLVATGHPNYGEMAYNLIKSIRYNSDIDITVLATEGALATVKERDFNLIIIPPQDSIGKLKTELIAYSPYDTTIYLDVDSLLCPGKDIKDFFNHPNPVKIPYEFMINTAGIADNFLHWVTYKYLKDNFPVIALDMPGAYQTSVIVFDKSDTAQSFFNAAREAYDVMLPHFSLKPGWYNTVPDEACFWAASATTGYFPEHNLFPHIFFGWSPKSFDRGHILKHHHLVTFPSAQGTLPQTSKYLYNDISTFYGSKLGKKGYQWKDKGTFRTHNIIRK